VNDSRLETAAGSQRGTNQRETLRAAEKQSKYSAATARTILARSVLMLSTNVA